MCLSRHIGKLGTCRTKATIINNFNHVYLRNFVVDMDTPFCIMRWVQKRALILYLHFVDILLVRMLKNPFCNSLFEVAFRIQQRSFLRVCALVRNSKNFASSLSYNNVVLFFLPFVQKIGTLVFI